MRHRPPVLLAGACLGLSTLLAAKPAIAVECTRPPASFSPGRWSGEASYIAAHDDDGHSDIWADRFVNFSLDVSPEGRAVGSLQLEAGGFLDGGDLDLASTGYWTVDAQLSGVASAIQAQGTLDMRMQAMIGISGGDDDIFFDGPRYMGHTGHIEKDTTFEFAPDEASCSIAVGDFGDNFQVRDEGEVHPFTWIAFRSGGARLDDAIARGYDDVVDASQRILGADEVDVDDLTEVVARLIGLNTVLAQPEFCSSAPEQLRPGSSANILARELLSAALSHVVLSAHDGTYTTADLITIMTLGLQAAALEPGRCGEDQELAYAQRHDLMRSFEEILELRLEDARAQDDLDEIDRILAAAYQFGFFGLLEG